MRYSKKQKYKIRKEDAHLSAESKKSKDKDITPKELFEQQLRMRNRMRRR